MRKLAVVFALAALTTFRLATPADAAPRTARYCAKLSNGGENCGYYSFQQCLHAIRGFGGHCHIAPWQTKTVYIRTHRGLMRVERDAID